MSSPISFDVELDLTQTLRTPYDKKDTSERNHHAFDKPLWQLLDILVPNFKRESVPPFLKTVKLRVHLSHENIHLLKCCQKRDKVEVGPGIFYKVIESSIKPKNANSENNDVSRNENNASNGNNLKDKSSNKLNQLNQLHESNGTYKNKSARDNDVEMNKMKKMELAEAEKNKEKSGEIKVKIEAKGSRENKSNGEKISVFNSKHLDPSIRANTEQNFRKMAARKRAAPPDNSEDEPEDENENENEANSMSNIMSIGMAKNGIGKFNEMDDSITFRVEFSGESRMIKESSNSKIMDLLMKLKQEFDVDEEYQCLIKHPNHKLDATLAYLPISTWNLGRRETLRLEKSDEKRILIGELHKEMDSFDNNWNGDNFDDLEYAVDKEFCDIYGDDGDDGDDGGEENEDDENGESNNCIGMGNSNRNRNKNNTYNNNNNSMNNMNNINYSNGEFMKDSESNYNKNSNGISNENSNKWMDNKENEGIGMQMEMKSDSPIACCQDGCNSYMVLKTVSINERTHRCTMCGREIEVGDRYGECSHRSSKQEGYVDWNVAEVLLCNYCGDRCRQEMDDELGKKDKREEVYPSDNVDIDDNEDFMKIYGDNNNTEAALDMEKGDESYALALQLEEEERARKEEFDKSRALAMELQAKEENNVLQEREREQERERQRQRIREQEAQEFLRAGSQRSSGVRHRLAQYDAFSIANDDDERDRDRDSDSNYNDFLRANARRDANGNVAPVFNRQHRRRLEELEFTSDNMNRFDPYGDGSDNNNDDKPWEQLPTQKLSGYDIEGLLRKDEDLATCGICKSQYEPGDEVRMLQCAHKFHSTCIDGWFVVQDSKNVDCTCPLDRHKAF